MSQKAFNTNDLIHIETTIQAWITARLAEELGIKSEQINPSCLLTTYGLDSLVAFNLTGELSAWLDQDFSATLLWEYPTIEALSQFLAAQVNSGSNNPNPTDQHRG